MPCVLLRSAIVVDAGASFTAVTVMLTVAATDVVALKLKDEVSQAVMTPVGAEGYDYTYVIMPMRI